MEHLGKRWKLSERTDLTGEACEAAEYLTKLPDRIRKLSERAAARKQKTKGTKANFSWVFDRPVELV
jgi:acyl-[acyl-carrier-protein] desaturase